MIRDKKILQYGLRTEGVLKNHIASVNHRKIFAWTHNLGTADQSGQEAIQLFEVHRLLVVKEIKNPAEAFEFGIGQWL
jgi:hypothetical protein